MLSSFVITDSLSSYGPSPLITVITLTDSRMQLSIVLLWTVLALCSSVSSTTVSVHSLATALYFAPVNHLYYLAGVCMTSLKNGVDTLTKVLPPSSYICHKLRFQPEYTFYSGLLPCPFTRAVSSGQPLPIQVHPAHLQKTTDEATSWPNHIDGVVKFLC